MAEGRRIRYDTDDDNKYKKLKGNVTFKDYTLVDLFSVAVAFGKKYDIRLPIGNKAIGKIRDSTYLSTDLPYLMMAIAVNDENSFDVLTDDKENGRESQSAEDKYITISEEYAKAGLDLFLDKFIDSDDIIDEMEIELLKFFDKNIEKDMKEVMKKDN